MDMKEVRVIAQKMNVPVGNKTKLNLIRDIQRSTGRLACYGVGIAADCGHEDCPWRLDCARHLSAL